MLIVNYVLFYLTLAIYKGPGDGDILGFAYYLIKYFTTPDTDMIKLLRKDKIYESLETTDLYENDVDVNDPQSKFSLHAFPIFDF